MKRIVVSEFMDEPAVASLAARFDVVYDKELVDRPDDLAVQLADADALIVRNRTSVDRALIASAPQLCVVGRLGVGLDQEHRRVQRVPRLVGRLGEELAEQRRVRDLQAHLLAGLPQGRLARRLPRLELAADQHEPLGPALAHRQHAAVAHQRDRGDDDVPGGVDVHAPRIAGPARTARSHPDGAYPRVAA